MTDPEAFVLGTGHGKSSLTHMKVQGPMCSVSASGIQEFWIHGEQKQASNKVKPGIKSSLEFLQERSPERLNGFIGFLASSTLSEVNRRSKLSGFLLLSDRLCVAMRNYFVSQQWEE